MWAFRISVLSFAFVFPFTYSLRFDPAYESYNLNENQTADNPLDYWGEWSNHTYNPSPSNWRFPFYTLFLDRFVNGDPTNDNANGTLFEHDITSTQFRHGGDLQGLIDTLDYIQGMGVKGLYIAGSPFINKPWQSDSYSPIDHTLLDQHFGNIEKWRDAITAIHDRGMYVLLDNTVATMSDLIGFEGYLNDSTPFNTGEYPVLWKSDRRYLDFDFGTEYNETCDFPRLWLENGYPVGDDVMSQFKGCYNGEFDQFGDTEAFGVYPDYRRQLTKFASVQDRLREWVPSVREKIEHFSCIAIAMLDIDGFRYDKATQVTVDATGLFSSHLRECARKLGKDNFFLPGEITGGNTFGSLYVGRGRQPDQYLTNLTTAVALTNATIDSDDVKFLRDEGLNGLDSAAFHYSIYRHLTRFLGMDGNLEAGYDLPRNWVDSWNEMLLTNDFLNPNTGVVDPRHMYGVTNQDVFRWPAIRQGTERMLLGQFITTLHMPGIPLLLWGEEQAFYVLDSTADNYIYGRQAMSSSPAWQMHGCYAGGSDQYYRMPLEAARTGCEDDTNSWDHRDPSNPLRNIIKAMYHMRREFPVLQDGLFLQQLSNQTVMIQYPGSDTTATETGLWSVMRSAFPGVQDLGDSTSIWLVYHNRNETTEYSFDCTSESSALIAPFDEGTTVKNLFFPHDELTLTSSPQKLGINGSTNYNGCSSKLEMLPYEFRAYVPKSDFLPPPAMITRFEPGHDVRIESAAGSEIDVKLEFHVSAAMDCDSFTSSLELVSSTEGNVVPHIDNSTIKCGNMSDIESPAYIGAVASAWTWSANLVNVADGIHQIVVNNASTADMGSSTNSVDRFLLRVGSASNPIVFPSSGNYSSSLLTKSDQGNLTLHHQAAGANQWRYSLNWGSTWSDWSAYESTESAIDEQAWSGTKPQAWDGDHVMVQYWSKLLGSSSFVQHGDVDFAEARRFPHLWANGPFNQFGFDAGLRNEFKQTGDSQWKWHFMDEWPTRFQINIWGINPDGQPDQSFVFGDNDGDLILDRLPPSSLVESAVNVTDVPPAPYLAYRVVLDDATLKYELVPHGDRRVQLALYVVLWLVPVLSSVVCVVVFRTSFYKVKYVEMGLKDARSKIVPFARDAMMDLLALVPIAKKKQEKKIVVSEKRRCVLIATMEYNIDDWDIKIKIGGLGVMAQLMGKSLQHQDLIWVVPCVGGIEYPVDTPAASMLVTIMGVQYEVKVQYHVVENITYVLLDAPVFRKQTKAEPYPPRMDDLDSAIYYSAWNQCIAQTTQRFRIDLYHINDYHGAAALLYLLPNTIPAAMSLHNAEFQGMWPMRTLAEAEEVCQVYNLDPAVVGRYVQYGSVFNLLHAGASYLRLHQKGFGAVGVSKKYGDRSFARYPILWGLKEVGQLPNPDPTDTAEWDRDAFLKDTEVAVDAAYEGGRADLKRQAQEWAGLEVNPKAELFVFVGRWSLQKGVDLIADIFPSILEQYPDTQLVCVGPVIDLYGKFAALKLSKLMEKYPKRVYSKPEFTALPPYLFSGAEFALIPSRDEPFGLVAVEFGRKGALGVGARVGGLGQMPGWWYTIESTSAPHLLAQFKEAITSALNTKQETRAMMRAWSAKQRFPVAQWLEDLEKLQSTAIKRHEKPSWKRMTLRARIALQGSEKVAAPPSPGHEPKMADKSPQVTETIEELRLPSLTTPGESTPGASAFTSGQSTPMCPATPELRPVDGPQPSIGELLNDWPLLMQACARGNVAGDFNALSEAIRSNPDALDQARIIFTLLNESIGSPQGHEKEPLTPPVVHSRPMSSYLSVNEVVGHRDDFKLQRVDLFFNDSRGEFYNAFEKKLEALSAGNSASELCIQDFLIKSEKEWFNHYRNAKMGRLSVPNSRPASIRAPSFFASPANRSRLNIDSTAASVSGDESSGENHDEAEDFGLARDYKPPTGLQWHLQRRIGDWPLYSILLALSQVIASNSYQITLLTGEVGQSATKLYVVASIYLASTIMWYAMSRLTPAIHVLSIPYAFYGMAFFILGLSPFGPTAAGRGWMQNVATGLYAVASSSGALAFAFNFGDEGGSPITVWIYRATLIQGLQQVYSIGLWAWGSVISSSAASGQAQTASLASSPYLLAVCGPIALALWTVGVVLFRGLPEYYRQTPGAVPMLWRSLVKRRTITWFLLAVVLQNYFLSAPYGRNWFFLFSSQHVPTWAVVLLALAFFALAWSLVLAALSRVSRSHPWLFPLFAVGLGAPRWAQMLWGTSGIGLYLPWAGGPLASALASRALWLWLGLLDGVQGAGIGMILMLTLTRVHVAAAVVAAQVLGSLATIAGRASAPDNLGPGDVFPDFSQGVEFVVSKAWFWVVMLLQLAICVGYFKFFRKEQVSKP
ncbi:alpha-1,3-glucan synthase [Xylariaceae sp. FL0016]|nr:alpha-1,3-glucan synthase [Xylariaceae sp. FL0016]